MKRWAIAIVVAGREREAQNLIASEQHLECWYPVGVTLTKPKKKHQPVKVVHPIFRGYIFVTFHPNTLSSLLSDPKYSFLLGYISSEGSMFPLDDEVVQDLKSREAAGEFDDMLAKMKERKTFHRGDKVLIRNSVLGNHINNKTGVVLEECINKAHVLVDVNGMKLKLAVAFAEKIA